MTLDAVVEDGAVSSQLVPTCRVERLRLHHFRNYSETTIHFGPRLNVISGRNAQGKTNLLEAVATLALTRSPRTSGSADLLQWGSDRCLAEAAVARPTRASVLTLRLERDPQTERLARTVSVDGKPRPAREILGLCPVVLFWPEDLLLVKGGPDGRRRLLDVLLAQLDHRAAAHLIRYRHVLEQRNALLHQLRLGGGGRDELPSFTRELAQHGAAVVVARALLVSDLTPLAATALYGLSDRREQLTLRYAPSHDPSMPTDASAEDVESSLLAALDARAAEEIARGVTVVGPHRDDIDIELDGRPARTTASQGQQRSIVLACKLAEVSHLQATSGVAPVILLDDVLSELDPGRRTMLFQMLAADAPHQIIVTTTAEREDTSAFTDVRYFTVRAGSVQESRA
jgi:DNA replication and repair protein RecF